MLKNQQTNNKNQVQNYKAFYVKIIWVYQVSPTTIWATCLSCHSGLQTKQHKWHPFMVQEELLLFPTSGIVKKQDLRQTIWWLQPLWHFCHVTLDKLWKLLASYIFYKYHVHTTGCSKCFCGFLWRTAYTPELMETKMQSHSSFPSVSSSGSFSMPPVCLPHILSLPQAKSVLASTWAV